MTGCVHRIHDLTHNASFEVPEGKPLLRGMELTGQQCIAVGCRNGGCGICKIRVVSGAFRCGRMSRSQISEREQQQGTVLACRIIPLSNLEVEVLDPDGHCRAGQVLAN
ncbi:2Fe-2S iron-sulfur cluster-binding protein [Pokkaliibacter sp. MBI-7]|uniref:2Fe-2S iron-sulfur cluster-binding protein n=1 Tax=Pokkaliibacter sp. MBI-7 TaxID=3040600 RepID=UPI00244792BF|nr:2Fe-2S iron-sulfur cluster-binding protein [Pokkaliibacter sp. MBI-7]MDH2435939.1 2Fe-2S iron-sulfur cluster-binding protein [Pokkaliibacter sp. MBI-7]